MGYSRGSGTDSLIEVHAHAYSDVRQRMYCRLPLAIGTRPLPSGLSLHSRRTRLPMMPTLYCLFSAGVLIGGQTIHSHSATTQPSQWAPSNSVFKSVRPRGQALLAPARA